MASAEPSPLLAAFEKHAHRVLSARCVAVADALLRETELSSPPRAPDPLLRPLARELLVGCLLRPLLGFCSPAWAHRGLAAMLAVEDDVAAAGGEAFEKHAPREGTEPTLLFPTKVPDEETLFEEEEKPKTFFGSEDSSSRVVVAARVAEAHIAGKGASAYAVYAARVRARTRASGDKETETETEWVVPRRFRNFEALHRRCEKEASETARRSDLGSFDAARASASASDSPPTVSDTTLSSDTRARKKLAFAPMPPLPKKRFALNSLDGAFVEARRAALDRYLVALVSCPRARGRRLGGDRRLPRPGHRRWSVRAGPRPKRIRRRVRRVRESSQTLSLRVRDECRGNSRRRSARSARRASGERRRRFRFRRGARAFSSATAGRSPSPSRLPRARSEQTPIRNVRNEHRANLAPPTAGPRPRARSRVRLASPRVPSRRRMERRRNARAAAARAALFS